jgi:hypothetical protein
MTELLIIASVITVTVILSYYFGIQLLYKYRKGITKILGLVTFISVIGYGMYKDYQDEKILENVLTEVTTEINSTDRSMLTDDGFHEFVEHFVMKKNGVNFKVVPQIDTAILKINKVYQNVLNDPDYKILITSANDSKSHSKNSAHYRGEAVDIRIKNIDRHSKNEIISTVKEILGDRFFILHEDRGKPNEHLHIQLKNKG